jgi:F-type H+-transporting ATPase subunit b
MAFLYDPEFWVAIAFLILMGIFIYVGVHRMLTNALDTRRGAIEAELGEAKRLKDEAYALLAAYEAKQREAEKEAAGIIEGAQAEAVRLAVEAKAKMEDFVVRRTKMAEGKIAQAEAQAVADVRAAAADAAVAAAEKILTRTVKGKVADDLIGKGIDDVKRKLN